MMHFAQSEDPIPFHAPGPIPTLCGKMLFDVELCFAFDGEICGRNLKELLAEQYELNSLSICRKCVNSEFTERYLSGLGQRLERAGESIG